MSGIPDLDQYCKQFPTVVTFEPGTLNLELISLGMYFAFRSSKFLFIRLVKVQPTAEITEMFY